MPPRAAKQDGGSALKHCQASRNEAATGRPDQPRVQVLFPACVNPRQRAILHAIAEGEGLPHASSGEGSNRRILIGQGEQVDLDPKSREIVITDDAICQLLQQHLHISDAAAHFQADADRKGSHGAASSSATSGTHKNGGAPGKLGSAQGQPSLEGFVSLTRQLVELERQAEVQQATDAALLRSPETAQARGISLLNLRCDDIEGGLLGRSLLTLTPNKGFSAAKGAIAPLLPSHKFSPHDVVALRPNKGPSEGPPLVQGVVYRVRDTAIVVAVDDVPEEGLEQPLRMEKLANEVTYKRLKDTLDHLAATTAGSATHPGGPLVEVLFGKREPRFVDTPPSWTAVNPSLDESQRRAISLALSAKDIALVHGPPGTGKTTAVVEIIRQEVARGSRVLACAASNIAVDNLVERLAGGSGSSKLRVVRLGHPARLLPQVLDCSLEAHVLRSDNSSLAKDCRKEIKSLNQKLMKLEHWKKAERRQLRDELRQLGKEERKRQQAAIAEVIKGAQVVAATLTGVLHHSLEGSVFDVAIIDEAAQALEAASWGALLKARRAVLAGDHLQLPPTIISEAAARQGLSRTLFERLQDMYAGSISEMLTVQYRMNTDIMQWSSDELYQGKLTAHASVADHTLGTLEAAPAKGKKAAAAGPPGPPPFLPVLLLIDTAGCGFDEQQEEEGDSRSNQGEAKAVMAHVKALINAGIPAPSIGIITPYNAQVALLKEMRPDNLAGQLEISSVDGFQGREKEAIIISMVRSNDKQEVGFLADRRRMNVAVTRARRQCSIVCNTETVAAGDDFLGRLIKYFEDHGEYISASELVPDD